MLEFLTPNSLTQEFFSLICVLLNQIKKYTHTKPNSVVCNSIPCTMITSSDSLLSCLGIQEKRGNQRAKGKGPLIKGTLNCPNEPEVIIWYLHTKTRLCLLFPSDLLKDKLTSK